MAKFLVDNHHLSKAMIGDYLGDRRNTEVLTAFVRCVRACAHVCVCAYACTHVCVPVYECVCTYCSRSSGALPTSQSKCYIFMTFHSSYVESLYVDL